MIKGIKAHCAMNTVPMLDALIKLAFNATITLPARYSSHTQKSRPSRLFQASINFGPGKYCRSIVFSALTPFLEAHRMNGESRLRVNAKLFRNNTVMVPIKTEKI